MFLRFVYMAFLAVFDLIVIIIGLGDLICFNYFRIIFRNKSLVLCRVHTFLLYVFTHLSSFVLASLSIDRAIATNLLKYAKAYCRPHVACKVVVLNLLLAIVVNFHNLLFLGYRTYDMEQTTGTGNSSDYDDPLNLTLSAMALKKMTTLAPATTQFDTICVAKEDSLYQVFVDVYFQFIDLLSYALVPGLIMFVCSILIIRAVFLSNKRMHAQYDRRVNHRAFTDGPRKSSNNNNNTNSNRIRSVKQRHSAPALKVVIDKHEATTFELSRVDQGDEDLNGAADDVVVAAADAAAECNEIFIATAAAKRQQQQDAIINGNIAVNGAKGAHATADARRLEVPSAMSRKKKRRSTATSDFKKRESIFEHIDRRLARIRANSVGSKKLSLTYTLISINVLFLCLTSPLVIVRLFVRDIENIQQTKTLNSIVYLLAYANHSFNFIFYGISSRPYRTVIIDFLSRACQPRRKH